MQQSHFLSQVAETSEPSGNRNFTDLLTELRVAQVSCIGILNINESKDYKNSYVCKKLYYFMSKCLNFIPLKN